MKKNEKGQSAPSVILAITLLVVLTGLFIFAIYKAVQDSKQIVACRTACNPFVSKIVHEETTNEYACYCMSSEGYKRTDNFVDPLKE